MEMPRKNRVKEKLKNGERAYIASGSTHANDIDAFGYSAVQAGIDGIWLEGEHGPVVPNEIGNLTRACDLWGLTSIVRVNLNSQGLIYRTLDLGAQGIVVPHVNNKEEAENVIQGGKFAPIGQRGFTGSRQGYGVSNFFEIANDLSLFVVLIEDIVAVNNLDEILKVDNIDVFFVAPGDLAQSMGYILDVQNKEVTNTIDNSLNKIMEAGKVAGTMVNLNNTAKFSKMGVQFLFAGTGEWMANGAKQFVDAGEG
jgi:4-hydroxy-2-oxoheptanedioate aldolase